MSDPKLISPLLDGFAMGTPISDHNGIRCCPAIRENSDKKYIVKIVSIPATQAQMDALLLAGAYRDPADAMEYYRQTGEELMKEAELLKSLSKLDGFVGYENWQMEPIMKQRLGYEVYLVSAYRRSLDKYVRRNPVTHLEAMNMALDLCAALATCRQAGALYVDLKPTNVFISDKKQFRIGDLGFIRMDALSYTALPDKYRSAYTPPELEDPMASVNLTVDTYALGMILYQLYNEGHLPPRTLPEGEALPSPVNADYELAAIILKAIDFDPAKRWQDPKELAKALVSYRQKNVVNDVPIVPYVPLEINTEDVAIPQETAEAPAEAAETEAAEAGGEEVPASDAEAAPEAEAAPVEDETLPGDADAETLMPHEMSDELSKILSKADDLISHKAPEGVVIPEVPEPPDPFAFAKEDEIDETELPMDPVMEEARVEPKPKRSRNFASNVRQQWLQKALATIASVLGVLLLVFVGYWYYKFQYLQTIDDMTVLGDRSQLIVSVRTSADPALITVTCSDNLGQAWSQPLSDGQAVFTGLQSDTMYTVRLEISGFHGLTGKTSDIYTTDSTTNITAFHVVTGSEDGSAVVTFTVDGDEPDTWILTAVAEDEEQKVYTFSGHTVNIDGLAIGKIYNLTLSAANGMALSGQFSDQFMASRLILAQDLTITSTGEGEMTVHWTAPGDVVVNLWSVRCYSNNGYEEQRTVSETEVLFTGVDPTASYTVEVTAEGMTQPARTSITANPVNITAFHADEGEGADLKLTWDYTGTAPEGGWLLMYTVDGSAVSNVLKCEEPAATITPRIPGAKYQVTVQAADTTSIFGNVFSYTSPKAGSFSEGGLDAQYITCSLLKTPEEENWTFDKVGKDALTTEFSQGDPISIVLHGEKNFDLPDTELEILYVIRDVHGNALPELASQAKTTWKDLWFDGDYHYGELNLPTVPDSAGNYVLTIYFNGGEVVSSEFSVS